MTVAVSGEEGTYIPFSISAEDGYRAGEWTAPSDADVSGTDNGFSGTAVCSGTDMSDGNTFRFSFAEDKETADNAPLPDTDKPVENAKADDGQKNEDITAETGEETVSKEASDTVVISGCEYTVTYDANGGTYGTDANGNTITTNTITYNAKNQPTNGTYVTPERTDGYVCVGWSTSKTATTADSNI